MKKAVKKVIIALLVMATVQAGHTKECNYKTNKGGVTETKEFQVVMTWSKGMGCAFLRENSNYYLKIGYQRAFSGRISIDADTPLVLTLGDGQVLSLVPGGDAASRIKIGSFLLTDKLIRSTYPLARERVELLKTHGLLNLEISFKKEDGTIISEGFAVKSKGNQRLKRNAECILLH
jgi:hypothetical protein